MPYNGPRDRCQLCLLVPKANRLQHAQEPIDSFRKKSCRGCRDKVFHFFDWNFLQKAEFQLQVGLAHFIRFNVESDQARKFSAINGLFQITLNGTPLTR